MENNKDKHEGGPIPMPPAQPEQTPPPRKPISLFKKILVVIFFVVSAFGVYDILFPSEPLLPPQTPQENKQVSVSNNPSAMLSIKPNEGWKTYTNKKYTYAIDYPADWTYREFPDTATGAGFRLADKPNNMCCEYITIDYSPKMGDDKDLPFENYVTIAGTGIQGFQKLESSKKITTTAGIVGYETTWQVQSLSGKQEISGPITYFPTKSDTDGIIMITIENPKDPIQIDTYNQMITTFNYAQ